VAFVLGGHMLDGVMALIGVFVGAFLESRVRKSIEREKISTDLHYLYTEVETNIIYLENIDLEKFTVGLDFQPLRIKALEGIVSSPAAMLLRGETLQLIIRCQIIITDFNQKSEKWSRVDVFGGSEKKREIESVKYELYNLLKRLGEFLEKRPFIEKIRMKSKV